MQQEISYNDHELVNGSLPRDVRLKSVRDNLKKMLEEELAKEQPTLGHGPGCREVNIHNSILPWGWT
jgi:hypothetical protein